MRQDRAEAEGMTITSSGAPVCAALGLVALVLAGVPSAAEPLVSQGIGASSCARLAGDLNPAEGLNNSINLLLFAWVQGFCKANPDKKPVAAIDELIRKSAKIKTKWEPGTVEWDE